MDFKNLLTLAAILLTHKVGAQTYLPVIVKSNSPTYTVPTGYNLKIESIGYSCNMEQHSDQITIDGETLKIRQHTRSESGSTNSQSQSVWEIKTPFWIPSGTVIGLNNHAPLQIYGLLVPNSQ